MRVVRSPRHACAFASLLVLAGVLAGCHRDPEPDAARIPSGSGWYCHGHPGGDDSICWRDEASCDDMLATYRKHDARYAAESCRPQPAAWCFVRDPKEPVPFACKVDEASCKAKAHVWNSLPERLVASGASECFEVM